MDATRGIRSRKSVRAFLDTPVDEVTIRRILDLYLANRRGEEPFIQFVERASVDAIRTSLFGAEVSNA